jgi:hypothetical protein
MTFSTNLVYSNRRTSSHEGRSRVYEELLQRFLQISLLLGQNLPEKLSYGL